LGQLIANTHIKSLVNESWTVRNDKSTLGTIIIPEVVGGFVPGVNAKANIYKLSPLPYRCEVKRWKKAYKCASHKEKNLICKLEKKLACDCDLMLKGSDAFGSFYNNTAQTVELEAPVLFSF